MTNRIDAQFVPLIFSMVGTRVYVGGLPYGTRERDLERFFRGYGRFRDVLIKNGYGFVEFDDYRDADDAVYELNGKELLGERITVERARGTPRGSDQWRYGDSRGGYGDSRRSARDDMRHDRYGPPTRTEYRLTVENLSSRVSWQDLKDYMRQAGEVTYADAHKQRRNEGVVEFATTRDVVAAQDPQVRDPDHDRVLDLVVDPAPAQGAAEALAVAADAAVVRNQGRIQNLNQNPNPSPPNVVAHVPNRNQETAQSRNLSQSPNPDLVLGPRLRGQNPGRSPNQKPSLPQRIDPVVNDQEATGHDLDQEANTAKAAVAPIRL
ncbi:hypothetical protein KPH14_006690 [Odynerus spinipes]|uniref:RRM domain-containing protein n=1 Tax=Odynerus spinipes TaxID=1348599 RepID=A0AAD9RRH9_9HYME|nr:hypothetical protein KPH14_006690 [Odynerus spinipes]